MKTTTIHHVNENFTFKFIETIKTIAGHACKQGAAGWKHA